MRILTRYVLIELLKVFLVSLTGMTLFFLLVGVFKEAYLQGLGVKQILLLIPYALPQCCCLPFPPRFCSVRPVFLAGWLLATK